MMKLKFSVEDILRDDTNVKLPASPSSHEGAAIDGRMRLTTSDGESVRSESPDSTTSMNSDEVDKKGARRIRTMIQHWQKELLEAAFTNHQYPTVHQYESLSKQLGLPHYVTKVWFQNRRSKSRKEGTREHNRRQCYPYPIKGQSVSEQVAGEKSNLREAGEQKRMEIIRSPPFLQKQTKLCRCDECVPISINVNAVERNLPPQSVAMGDVCNCGECISRLAGNGPFETRLLQQSGIDSLRFPMQYRSQRPKRLCTCEDCMTELQKIDDRVKLRGGTPHALHSTETPDVGFPMQFMPPQAGSEVTHMHSTLHYLAVPSFENNHHSKHVDSEFKQRCNCNKCHIGIKGSRY